MKIEVYCDESRPELFTAKKETADRYMLISSIWLRNKIIWSFRNECDSHKM
jgi:hypothetical protein